MELNNDFQVSVPIDVAWDTLTDVERIAPCMPGAELREVEGDEYRGVVKVKVGPITAEYRGKASFVEKDPGAHRAVLRAEGRETRGQGNAAATITAELRPEGSATAVSVLTDLAITGKVAQFGRGVLADVSAKLLGQFVESLETTVLNAPGGPGGFPSPSGSAPASAGGPATSAGSSVSPAASVGPADQSGGVDGAVAARDPESGSNGAAGPAASAAPNTGNGGTAGSSATGEPAGGGPAVRTLSPRPAEPVDLVGVAGSSVARRLAPVVLPLLVLLVVWRVGRRLRR